MQINRCPKCGQEPILAEEFAIEFSLGWLVESSTAGCTQGDTRRGTKP